MEASGEVKSNKSPSLLSKFTSDSTLMLALVPFAFSLIVFMFQVGKFLFFDIPLEYISISLGKVLTVWAGLFIAFGVLGFGLLNFLIEVIHQFKLWRFFRLVLLVPLTMGIIIFLFFFPITPTLLPAICMGLISFFLLLLEPVGDLFSSENKSLGYLDRIENSQRNQKKTNRNPQDTMHIWQQITGRYYLIFFFAYLILGVPAKLSYILTSNETRHWVDDMNHAYILVDAQTDYYVLKEFEPEKGSLKPGYLIRPVSNAEVRFIEVDTGKLSKPKT